MATNKFSNIKNRVLLILLSVVLACASALFLTACDDDDDYTDKSYSYEWSDESDIVNGSFEYGTNNVSLEEYPYNSADSWSLSNDDGATSSLITSGIIRTNDEAWKELLATLYDDDDFIDYAEKKWNFSIDEIKTANSAWTEEEIKNHVIETYLTEANFANPKTHTDAEGDKVYMLNNYPSLSTVGGIGVGTAQILTSSSSITLEKGSYGKITVWVKTQNLANFGFSTKAGANIRLSNTLSSTKQADYRINGINTQTSGVAVDANGWAKYELLVKADDFVNCSVIVEVGLGYGNGSASNAKDYCEGTVYFDDITFEEIEESEYNASVATETIVKYETASENPIDINAGTTTVFRYSMSIDDSINAYASNYYQAISVTPSGTALHGTGNYDNAYTAETYKGLRVDKIDVNGGTFSLKFGTENSPVSTLAPETYSNVVFYLKADLGEFAKNQINVYVYDVNKNLADNSVKFNKSPRITITPEYENDEWIKVSFTLNNNFPEKDADGKYVQYKHGYFFEIVIGPYDVDSVVANEDFANGSVYVTEVKIAEGKTYNYERENYVTSSNAYGTYYTDYTVKDEKPGNKTAFNDYYFLVYGESTSTGALYSAYSDDWTEESESSDFAMTVSPSATGAQLSGAANPDGFTGVSSDHGYINSASTNFVVNDRAGNGNESGVAGIINTKYVGSYALGSEIKSKLNHKGSDDAQVLMIKNKTAGAYGFIGESLPLSASGTLQISVKVRVTDAAVAYVYLVDTSVATKNVMSINVPVNTDGTNYFESENIQNKTGVMAIKVTSAMMREDEDGWVTLNFYIAAGNKAKNFRLELWNGARDGSENSQGYVFFDEVYTSGTFTETSADYLTAWTEGVLLEASIYDKGEITEMLLHRRELDETEIAYNKDSDRKNDAVSYPAKYVWVKTPTTVYAIFNSLEYDAVDPYEAETDDEDTGSGCTAETDPATFWMQFSTILLAVALVVALIALIVKGIINRKKANANDAKSHYNVTSKYKTSKNKKSDKPVKTESEEQEPEQDDVFDTEAETEEIETAEEENTQTEEEKPSLDEYVYGDVQDFGSEEDKNE